MLRPGRRTTRLVRPPAIRRCSELSAPTGARTTRFRATGGCRRRERRRARFGGIVAGHVSETRRCASSTGGGDQSCDRCCAGGRCRPARRLARARCHDRPTETPRSRQPATPAPSSASTGPFRVVASHVPPPAGVASPMLWGIEAHLRELLGDGIAAFAAPKRTFTFRFRSAEEFAEFFRLWYGPTLKAFAALDGDAHLALERPRPARAPLEPARNRRRRDPRDLPRSNRHQALSRKRARPSSQGPPAPRRRRAMPGWATFLGATTCRHSRSPRPAPAGAPAPGAAAR
jgi:hypothetical protein